MEDRAGREKNMDAGIFDRICVGDFSHLPVSRCTGRAEWFFGPGQPDGTVLNGARQELPVFILYQTEI